MLTRLKLDDVLVLDGPPLVCAIRLDALLPRLLQYHVACNNQDAEHMFIMLRTAKSAGLVRRYTISRLL